MSYEGGPIGALRVVPVDWRTASAFVETWHRHHKAPAGHKFSLGVARDRETRQRLADGAGADHPHPFVPGIDADDPENPSTEWCNTCGERHPDPNHGWKL